MPDLYVESFNAGVDYLGTRPFIDREKIGALGICGSGGFAIAATKIDPRIKALATVSMYDMGEYFIIVASTDDIFIAPVSAQNNRCIFATIPPIFAA